MPKQNDPLLITLKSKCSPKSNLKSTSKVVSATSVKVAATDLASDLAVFTSTIVDRIEMVALADLKAHPRRTRTHDDRQITMMMGSFNQFGFLNPLLIDDKNIVLAGDARWEAACRLGIAALPAVRIGHLSEAQKRAYKIADNRIAELAGWDLGELSIEFDELIEIGFNMDAIGFDTPTIDLVLSQAADEATNEPDPADDIPNVEPGSAVSRSGDIWLLGSHRVGCGSALDADFLARLMGGDQAGMTLTDAPYNCPIDGFVGGLGKVKHREFAMASGEMTRLEFLAFLTTASENTSRHLADGGIHTGFMDWRQLGTYMDALEAAGLTQINLCVWDKQTGGMGSLYRSQHELALVYKKGSAPHTNNVELGKHGRYRTNVWSHPGMSSFGKARDEALSLHPTVKPVNLLVEAIKDVTHPGDIVLDTFLGSGSTLIAAEKSKRVCRGIELDPIYVDTIIRRFEAFTGLQAIHAETSKCFAEMATLRAAEAEEGLERQAQAESSSSQQISDAAEAAEPLLHVRRRVRSVPAAGTVAQSVSVKR